MQRDLSISFNKLGDVSVESGELTAARVYFADGLTIRKQLAQADPTNAQMQRDVAVSHANIAGLLEKEHNPAAVDSWRACLGVFQKMIDAGLRVSPQDLKTLDWLRKKIGS